MLRLTNKLAFLVILAIVASAIVSTNVFAEPKYKECLNFLNYGNYARALKCSEELQVEDSSWYYPLYIAAKAYRGMNRKNEAIRSLREAADLASGNKQIFPVLYEMSHIYFSSWKNKAEQNKAEKFCLDAKGVAETTEFQKRIFSLCGKIYFKMQDWPRAEKDLKRAYQKDRKNAGIAEYYIRAMLKRGKTKQAERELRKAPKNVTTYGMLAEVYIRGRNFKGAQDSAKSCLKIDRLNKKCMLVQADAYIGLKDWKNATKVLQKYTTMYQDDWQGNKKLGEVFLFTKNFTRAITYLRKAGEKTPRQECDTFIQLAVAYENLFVSAKARRNLNAAKSAIDVAGIRCPTNSKYLSVLARIKIRIDDLDRGFDEIDCDKQPDHPECKNTKKSK